MKNILCILGFHKWTNWEHVRSYNGGDEFESCCKRKRCPEIRIWHGKASICLLTKKKVPMESID